MHGQLRRWRLIISRRVGLVKLMEAHGVSKGKLEGGGVTLHPELDPLRGLSQAGRLQLIQSRRGVLDIFLVVFVDLVSGSGHASKGEGGEGNSGEGHGREGKRESLMVRKKQ